MEKSRNGLVKIRRRIVCLLNLILEKFISNVEGISILEIAEANEKSLHLNHRS